MSPIFPHSNLSDLLEPLRSSVVENIHRIHQAKESLGGVADSPSNFLVKWDVGFG
jgi:hypothetical protein